MHDQAARVDQTDWPQILALYDVLERLTENPMVTLNRAFAFAMVHGPEAGLARLALLDSDARLAGHHRLDAVRAHPLEMSGARDLAIAHFRAAAERTTSTAEQNYLLLKAGRLAAAATRA